MSRKINALTMLCCVWLIVGLSFSLAVPQIAEAAEITVSVGHNEQPGSKGDRDVHFFAELVKVKSEGRIFVKEFPASLLGKPVARLEGVVAGTHEIDYQVSPIVGLVKEESYWDLPFLFKDRDSVTRLIGSPLKKEMEQNYLKKGLVLLGYFENGYRYPTNNVRPIRKPDDLKGLKIRVAPGPTKILIWKTYGAAPTPMAYGDLYQALKQGVVDGQDNPLTNIYGSKFQEVQKYVSLVGYVYNPQIMVAGKPFWDKLPDWARGILLEAASEAASASRYKGIYEEEELRVKLEKLGMQVNTITDEERKLWEKASEPIYEVFSKDIGKEFLQKILKVVKG